MKINIHKRLDTAGDPAPVISNGIECHYMGHAYKDDGDPIVTAWGITPHAVLDIITNHLRQHTEIVDDSFTGLLSLSA